MYYNHFCLFVENRDLGSQKQHLLIKTDATIYSKSGLYAETE